MEKLDLVVKIGSMALIQKDENAIDYNIFQRLGGDLRPGMILVTSGATEIGRLDYLKRTGHELTGVTEQDKVDYSAQGQTILMNTNIHESTKVNNISNCAFKNHTLF